MWKDVEEWLTTMENNENAEKIMLAEARTLCQEIKLMNGVLHNHKDTAVKLIQQHLTSSMFAGQEDK